MSKRDTTEKEFQLSLLDEVRSKLLVVRRQQVLLDADVARFYGVETRIVNQAVRNNPDKFPEGYMFRLDKQELDDLRSKILIANVSSKSRILSAVFTKRGCICWPLS